VQIVALSGIYHWTLGFNPLVLGALDGLHGPSRNRAFVVDWKTSARRWPEGKAATDLQPTCYLWAEHQLGHEGTRFRFEVVTKTKVPACERHPAAREGDDFTRLGELARVLEIVVANKCFHPRDGGWECANCPYATACKEWHGRRTKSSARPLPSGGAKRDSGRVDV